MRQKSRIPLNDATLPKAHYRKLVAALLKLDVMSTADGRDRVLAKVRPRVATDAGGNWVDTIHHDKTPRWDVMAIWDAASACDGTEELLGGIEDLETRSPALEELRDLIADYQAAVETNRALYPVLPRLKEFLKTVPQQTTTARLDRLRSAQPGIPDADEGDHDLLLKLGEFGADREGHSFPLFMLLDGVAEDSLEGAELGRFRRLLDRLAKQYGVTPAGIANLRKAVGAMRHPDRGRGEPAFPSVADRSILVVIEPDRQVTTASHYFVRVYDWLPWESAATVQEMGSTGCARDVSYVWPSSRPREFVFSPQGKAEIGREVGRRLRAVSASAILVEFLVPGSLLCEDFEAIKVDLAGEVLPCVVPLPLGVQARVVVRSLDRWNPQFRKVEWLMAHWIRRWCGFNSQNRPRPCWWTNGASDIGAAVSFMIHPDREHIGFFALGFAPVGAPIADSINYVLLRSGVPVALWVREACGYAAEALLNEPLDDEPTDLRDRVRAARSDAGSAREQWHVGKALTLYWDDPERPPLPYDGIETKEQDQ